MDNITQVQWQAEGNRKSLGLHLEVDPSGTCRMHTEDFDKTYPSIDAARDDFYRLLSTATT